MKKSLDASPFSSLVDNIKRAKGSSNEPAEPTQPETPDTSGALVKKIQPGEVSENIYQLSDEIRHLKTEIEQNVWLIGERLHYIMENQLYKRLNYTNFEAFANEECEFKGRTAFKYLAIYQTFSYSEIGVIQREKLYLLTKVQDPETRKLLKERVEAENLSTRQLEQEIKLLPESKSTPKQKAKPRYFELKEIRQAKHIRLQVDLPENISDQSLELIKDQIQQLLESQNS